MTQLTPRNFNQTEYTRNLWSAEPEYGTPPEALLDPAYWAHVSAKMKRGDIITAFPLDNSFYLELLVVDVGKLFAKVCQLRCIKIGAAQMLNVDVPEGFAIKFRGPRKWSVLRGEDVLKEDMEKSVAEQWLKDHVSARAA